jgi:hypothetical protein
MNEAVLALHERAASVAAVRTRALLLRAEVDRAIKLFPVGQVQRWLIRMHEDAVDAIDDADRILTLFKET